MLFEELRRDPFARSFVRNCFGAVFTILVATAVIVGVGPRTTRAIDAPKLIETVESGTATNQPGFTQGKPKSLPDCGCAARDLGVLPARGRGVRHHESCHG